MRCHKFWCRELYWVSTTYTTPWHSAPYDTTMQCILKFHTMHCWRALTTTYTCLGATGFLSDTACLHVWMWKWGVGDFWLRDADYQLVSDGVSLLHTRGTVGEEYHTKGHSKEKNTTPRNTVKKRIPHQVKQWGKGYHTKGHTFAIFCIGRYIIEFTKKTFETQSV